MPMACARRVCQSDREPPGYCGLRRGPVPRTVICDADREWWLAALLNYSIWNVQERALAPLAPPPPITSVASWWPRRCGLKLSISNNSPRGVTLCDTYLGPATRSIGYTAKSCMRKYSSRLRLSSAFALRSKIENHILNTAKITKRADIYREMDHDNSDDTQ
jgi:hypothetical protein